MMAHFVTVCKVGSIPMGEGRAYAVNDTIVALFNDGGTYRAINDMCPHMGASLADGDLKDGKVTCPWHAWRFSVRDGTWCDNPRIKIEAYRVRVVGEEVQVALTDGVDESGEPSP